MSFPSLRAVGVNTVAERAGRRPGADYLRPAAWGVASAKTGPGPAPKRPGGLRRPPRSGTTLSRGAVRAHHPERRGSLSPMLAKLSTYALVGIEAVPVEVEVDAAPGLPKTVLVGLPELAVKESIHRIERALANLGYDRHSG